MSKYPKEFREQIVALCNAGKRPAMLSREYDVPVQNIYSWLRRETESLEPKKVLSDEEKEKKRLEKEIADLKLENEILKKAVLIIGKKQQ